MASINLGEVQEKRFKLFEPEGRVLGSPGTSLRFIKKMFQSQRKMISVWTTTRQLVMRVPTAFPHTTFLIFPCFVKLKTTRGR